jgi:hypothetical protein
MPKPKKEPPYAISVLLDREYTSSGETMMDALKTLPVPVKVVSKGLVKITNGGRKLEEVWMPVRLKRLFRPLARIVVAKQLELLLR